jgi:hypothetical protein
VTVPHLHWKVTGQQPDRVYKRARGWLDEDRDSYWRWLRDGSDADVATVKAVLRETT